MDINEIIRQVTEEICSKYGVEGQAPAASNGKSPADMAKYRQMLPSKTSARSVTVQRSTTPQAFA